MYTPHRIALLSAVALLVTAAAFAETTPLIFICQDEASIERQIKGYIEEKYEIEGGFQIINEDNDDIVVTYTLSAGEETPKFEIKVDTMVSGRNTETEEITERCIKIYGWYELPAKYKAAAYRPRIMELNRSFMERKWVPHRVYLDRDTDVAFETFINIPGPNVPIHAEMINDMLRRNLTAWEEYYKELQAVLNQ